MSYEIKYRSKWTGKTETKVNKNSEADARAWTRTLAKENGSKAVCERVESNGSRTHVTSEGSD